MGPEQKQITEASGRSGAGEGCKIADFASILVRADYELIDLVRTEPGYLDWRVSDNEFLELGFPVRQYPKFPFRPID